ncbi:hypothetical protein [Kangiella sp.]|uniref:hypothetical protein n=1 Tax=Kangiella sp. TaxID=1920245 RepID=UPI0019A3B981|nr:hypothetical protein [Kangiella sp.]MBD3652722.1 hypothetical protein [Kangiella sp.]
MKLLIIVLTFFVGFTAAANEPQKHYGYFKFSKGQIGEACPDLKEGQTLTYSIKSNKLVKFNFHYHQDDEVIYPVENHETKEIKKTFTAPIDQTYCLMWTGLEDDSAVEMEYFIQ